MNDDARSDAQLLAVTARGDDAAFAVLVRRYIRPATLLSVQLLGDRDDAEDVAQDAFTVVHRNAAAFDKERAFPAWFFAIVRRLAASRRARELRRMRLLRWFRLGSVSEQASERSEDAVLARVDADAVRRAMKKLSPMQRACFELVAVRGLSTEEVAIMHGVSESRSSTHDSTRKLNPLCPLMREVAKQSRRIPVIGRSPALSPNVGAIRLAGMPE